MDQKDKFVLVLERSTQPLKFSTTENGKSGVLEGIFLEFGKENLNNRIYGEEEFLPHLESLNERIKSGNLVGELDHPEKMEPSLTRASHIIEKLEYDKEKRQILGRIRLLSTDAGRNAKALMDDGVQLSISLRALGKVRENKKVEIQKVITYDIVNEPGFANAKLQKINESLGLVSDTIGIFELNEDENKSLEAKNQKENKMEINDNNKYIALMEMMQMKFKQFEDKIEYLTENLNKNTNVDSITESQEVEEEVKISVEDRITIMENYLKEFSESVVDKNDEISEKLNGFINNVELMENYLSEFSEDSKFKTEAIEEYLDIFSEDVKVLENYVSESSEDIKLMENYVRENSNDVVNTVKIMEGYLDEFSKDVMIQEKYIEQFSEDIVERKQIEEKYLNYVAETFEIEQDRVSTILENSTLKPSISSNSGEIKEFESNAKDLKEKFNSILENVQKVKVTEDRNTMIKPYLNLLSMDKLNEFYLLDKNQKEKVLNGVLEFRPLSESEFIKIWEEAVRPEDANDYRKKIEGTLPNSLYENWKVLPENTKLDIIQESKFWNLTSKTQQDSFWFSRPMLNERYEDLVEQVDRLNESLENNKVKNFDYDKHTDEYMNGVFNALDRMNFINK